MDELEKIKAEATQTLSEGKSWLERYLIWIIAGGFFSLGLIVRSLV